MTTRRRFLQWAALGTCLPRSWPAIATVPFAKSNALRSSPFDDLPTEFAILERASGGRLGVAVLDTGTRQLIGYRPGERFAMCSTFKVLLAGGVLRRVDRGQETLDTTMPIPPKPLVGHSPLTEPHAGARMTLAALCHAALTQSDNTAANLLLENLGSATGDAMGGPAALTAFARSLGDSVTRLDRTEPSLNEAKPGDPRDTTSPAAMAADLERLLLGTALSKPSREQLKAWMVENQYGADRLRAHLPPTWEAADKTGSDGSTTSNDIAVYWPPAHAPLLVTAFLTDCPGPETQRAATLAAIAARVFKALSQS